VTCYTKREAKDGKEEGAEGLHIDIPTPPVLLPIDLSVVAKHPGTDEFKTEEYDEFDYENYKTEMDQNPEIGEFMKGVDLIIPCD